MRAFLLVSLLVVASMAAAWSVDTLGVDRTMPDSATPYPGPTTSLSRPDVDRLLPQEFDTSTPEGAVADWLQAWADPAAWDDPPDDVESLFDSLSPDEPFPVPEAPPGPTPLLAALMQWTHARDGPPLDTILLQEAVEALGMGPEKEAAVSRLVLAYLQAQSMHEQAVAPLTEQERAFLSLHPSAIESWAVENPGAGPDDLDAAMARLVAKMDVDKNLQAASLLARTVETVREDLSKPSARTDPVVPDPFSQEMDRLREALMAAFPPTEDLVAPEPPALPLGESLRWLAIAAGDPDPGIIEVPATLPTGVETAISRIVMAHAGALSTPDPLLDGLALLEAVQEGRPAMDAYADLLSLPVSALQDLAQPMAASGPYGPYDRAKEEAEDAIEENTEELPGGETVTDTLEEVPDGDDLPLADELEDELPDSDGDGIPDDLEIVLGTDPDDPTSRPVGNVDPFGIIVPERNGPLLTIGRPNEDPSAPALLIIGSPDDETVQREALVHVDLGGDDTYKVPVGTVRNLLVEIAGDDTYDTPTLEYTQGGADGLGVAALLDLSGDDRYRAAAKAQGSSCCNPHPTEVHNLTDPWEFIDQNDPTVRSFTGGLGLLADLAGNDQYEATTQSHGYGGATLIAGEATNAAGGDVPIGERGFAGILFDAAGDDEYRYSTQGFAEYKDPGSSFTRFQDYGRVVGLFIDAAGIDRYYHLFQTPDLAPRSSSADPSEFFFTQGYARSDGTEGIYQLPTPVGAFFDLSDQDEYWMTTQDGHFVNASMIKNNARRDPDAVADTDKAPIGFYLDFEVTEAQNSLLDEDGDGASMLIESVAGTDPGDPDDNPGTLFRTEGDPLEGPYLVHFPRPLNSQTEGLGLVLPGLAIGAEGDTYHSTTFDLFIDLGGNDTYTAPGHGGANVGRIDAGDIRGRVPVTLAVDVDGDDQYTAQRSIEVASESSVFLTGGGASQGGAILGVAVLADLSGDDRFHGRLSTFADHKKPLDPDGGFGNSKSIAWGVTQGAGLMGGVGALLTWDGEDQFFAEAEARASDRDSTIYGEYQATAAAHTTAQGAGYMGMGILASLGDGDDEYQAQAHATASAPRSAGYTRTWDNVAQGAGYGGTGILLDSGGDNRFYAPNGIAQGTGWGLFGDLEYTLPMTIGQGAGPLSYFHAGVGMGALLATGTGDDTYDASGPAQASGGSAQGMSLFRLDTRYDGTAPLTPDPLPSEGGAGWALLLDRGGDDQRRIRGPGERLKGVLGDPVIVSQAAALPGSTAVLLDLGGNDRYQAEGGKWVQAAALGGAAVLLDMEGQDHYLAEDQAQGYATPAATFSVDPKACMVPFLIVVKLPCNNNLVSVPIYIQQAGDQIQASAHPQLGALAVLMDVDGGDFYRAGQEAQGFVSDHAETALSAAYCHREGAMPDYLRQENVAPCPIPEGKNEFEDPIIVGHPNNPDYIDPDPLGPPVRGPLVGLLIDSDGTDSYQYGDQGDDDKVLKSLVEDGETPEDYNNWRWQQEYIEDRNLNQTGFPQNPVAGPVDEPDDSPAEGEAGKTVYEASKGYPPEFPEQSLPRPPTLGGGIDARTLQEALELLAGNEVVPLEVVTYLARDPAGEDRLEPGQVEGGTLYVFIEAIGPGNGAIARADVMSRQTGFLGSAQPVGNDTYRMAWDTRALDETDTPLYGDGPYEMIGVAVIGSDGLPGRSVESDPFVVKVDNDPIITLKTDRLEWSARTYNPAPDPLNITFVVGRDARYPQGFSGAEDPGGFVTLGLVHEDGLAIPLNVSEYHTAGAYKVSFAGRDGNGDPYPDGAYELRLAVQDWEPKLSTASMIVYLNSTAPQSRTDLASYVGLSPVTGPAGVDVGWTLDGVSDQDLAGLVVDLLQVIPEDPETFPALLASGTATSDDVTVERMNAKDVIYPQGSVTLKGLEHGQTYWFLTVAEDRLGNSESPCAQNAQNEDSYLEPEEDDPRCFGAGLGDVVQTTFDFEAPLIEEYSVSSQYVRPGADVTFSACIAETGSGLKNDAAILEFTPEGGTIRLEHQGPCDRGELYTNSTWGLSNQDLTSDETTYGYTVNARDLADNEDDRSGTFLLDGRPPRMPESETLYRELGGGIGGQGRLEAGRPGAVASLRARVVDASMDTTIEPEDVTCEGAAVEVCVDLSPLGTDLGIEPMDYDPASDEWDFTFVIPEVQDETYFLDILAWDAAGNQNVSSGALSLVVDSEGKPVGRPQAIEVSFDSVTFEWRSQNETQGMIEYGRTANRLNKATPRADEYSLVHQATVSDLAPYTQYSFRAAGVSKSGVTNYSEVMSIRTASAIGLTLHGIEEGATYSGPEPLRVEVIPKTGTDIPASLTVRARPVRSDITPIPLLDLPPTLGERTFQVDFGTLTDGAWRLEVEASRSGDRATILSEVFHVDVLDPFILPVHPEPEGLTSDPRPNITIATGDPGGDPLSDWIDSIVLKVDDRIMAAVVSSATLADTHTGTQTYTLRPADAIDDGRHEISVAVTDMAGNTGKVVWPVIIDSTPPTLTSEGVVGPEGSDHVAPGGVLRFEATAADETGLAAVWVDASDVSGPSRLVLNPGEIWSGQWRVPGGLPEGRLYADLWAQDLAGNRIVKERAVAFTLDSTPPILERVEVVNGTSSIGITALASEPVLIGAGAGSGDPTVQSDAHRSEATLVLEGLRPDKDHQIRLLLTDRAGLTYETLVPAHTLPDTEPPTPPRALFAWSLSEGEVDLSWSPADDAGGIHHYELWHSGDPVWRPLETEADPSGRLHARLSDVTGSPLTVAVRAIDLAENAGRPAEQDVEVMALPHLWDAFADQDVIESGREIRFSVWYQHGAGLEPASVTLNLPDRTLSMQWVEGDCAQACLFERTTTMSTHQYFDEAPRFWVEATDGVHQTSTTKLPAPLVLADDEGPRTTPGLGVLLPIVLMAILRRRWTR